MANRKILLADDSVTIQKVVNLTFADEGVEVIAVGDGDAAMEKFVESLPDLVMVDVNMPGFDGYRICEMIKQDEETKHIPVILLVGSFEPFDEEKARRAGADDFLTKPFESIRLLASKVSALLDGAGIANEIPVSATGEAFSSQNENTLATRLETSDNVPAESKSDTAQPQFGEAETDDKMIQTNQIGSLPADESQKFSAGFASEDFSQIAVTKPLENLTDYQAEEIDWVKTQPLNSENFDETISVSVAQDSSNENVNNRELLPQNKYDESVEATRQPENLSSEIIDAVAAKVVEKLSDKAIREIALQIVPQMANSIIREMVREKLDK